MTVYALQVVHIPYDFKLDPDLYSTKQKAINAGKRRFKLSVWDGKSIDLGSYLICVDSKKVR